MNTLTKSCDDGVRIIVALSHRDIEFLLMIRVEQRRMSLSLVSRSVSFASSEIVFYIALQ